LQNSLLFLHINFNKSIFFKSHNLSDWRAHIPLHIPLPPFSFYLALYVYVKRSQLNPYKNLKLAS
jgi:hypothetical protein